MLEHGFLDFIVDRRELKQRLADLLGLLQPAPVAVPAPKRAALKVQ